MGTERYERADFTDAEMQWRYATALQVFMEWQLECIIRDGDEHLPHALTLRRCLARRERRRQRDGASADPPTADQATYRLRVVR